MHAQSFEYPVWCGSASHRVRWCDDGTAIEACDHVCPEGEQALAVLGDQPLPPCLMLADALRGLRGITDADVHRCLRVALVPRDSLAAELLRGAWERTYPEMPGWTAIAAAAYRALGASSVGQVHYALCRPWRESVLVEFDLAAFTDRGVGFDDALEALDLGVVPKEWDPGIPLDMAIAAAITRDCERIPEIVDDGSDALNFLRAFIARDPRRQTLVAGLTRLGCDVTEITDDGGDDPFLARWSVRLAQLRDTWLPDLRLEGTGSLVRVSPQP